MREMYIFLIFIVRVLDILDALTLRNVIIYAWNMEDFIYICTILCI